MSKAINILLVDDHSLIRDGIKAYLVDSPFTVIGEANNGIEAIKQVEKLQPDLVLMDISMPEMNGMEASKKIIEAHPSIKIIILSMHLDEQFIEHCLEIGVHGYLFKSVGRGELIEAMQATLNEQSYYSQEVREKVMSIFTNKMRNKKKLLLEEQIVLTNREKEVVRLVMQGLTSIEIAEKLFISSRTVDTHRANLMQKLQAKNTIELIKKVQEQQLIEEIS